MSTGVASRLLVSIHQAAESLGGIGRSTVYRMIERGDLEGVKIGRRTFITTQSLENYVREHAFRGSR